MGRLLVILFCTALCTASAGAQGVPSGAFQTELKRVLTTGLRTSVSGQFTIHEGPASIIVPPRLEADALTNYVRVDPALLAVTSERVKAALLTELNISDQWRGPISLHLHRARALDEQVTIASFFSERGWNYSVDLPDTISRTRLISAVLNVVLLEMADRGARRSAEIPPWLAQGLTREFMLSSTVPLIVDQPEQFGAQTGYLYLAGNRRDPMTQTHDDLQNLPPLTLEQLSWPRPGTEESDSFRSSAQLFVHELLRLEGGRPNLAAFIQRLGQNLNWQTTFFQVFHAQFATQLDLEKWWTLKLVRFTGRDLTQTWPAVESWRRLDEILKTQVQVRYRTDELPQYSQASLTDVIGGWSMAYQSAALGEKSQQLFQFRARVSQDLIFLVDDYRRLLDEYLKKRDSGGYLRKSKLPNTPGLDRTAQETLRQLQTLERRRDQLRPVPTPAGVAAVKTTVNR